MRHENKMNSQRGPSSVEDCQVSHFLTHETKQVLITVILPPPPLSDTRAGFL